MKRRTGFVSNSSSSSFVCEICGEISSGMDASLSDLDMCECQNGHCMDKGCIPAEAKAAIDEYFAGDDRDEDFDETLVPARLCPVCQLRVLGQTAELQFLRLKVGLDEKAILEAIKKEHPDSLSLEGAYLKWKGK